MGYIADIFNNPSKTKAKLKLYSCSVSAQTTTPGIMPNVYFGYGRGTTDDEARKHFYSDLLHVMQPYDRIDMMDVSVKEIDFQLIEEVYLDNV